MFFCSLFTLSLLKSFIGPEGPEKAVLRYWLAFSLRDRIPDSSKNMPTSVFNVPFYVKNTIPIIKNFISAQLFTSTTVATHRAIYTFIITKLYGPGRVEILKPSLDWNKIWKWVAKLKDHQRDTMFLFNHGLLPSRSRLHRLKMVSSAICGFCNAEEESDDHIMTRCSKRREITEWLQTEVVKLGCNVPLEEAIRGHVNEGRNRK